MELTFTNELDYITNSERIKRKIIDKLLSDFQGSIGLKALSQKIEHMVLEIGCPNSVKPMLERMIKKGVKKQSRPGGKYSWGTEEGEYYGQGHFRWNHSAIVLTPEELSYIKGYFDI